MFCTVLAALIKYFVVMRLPAKAAAVAIDFASKLSLTSVSSSSGCSIKPFIIIAVPVCSMFLNDFSRVFAIEMRLNVECLVIESS